MDIRAIVITLIGITFGASHLYLIIYFLLCRFANRIIDPSFLIKLHQGLKITTTAIHVAADTN